MSELNPTPAEIEAAQKQLRVDKIEGWIMAVLLLYAEAIRENGSSAMDGLDVPDIADALACWNATLAQEDGVGTVDEETQLALAQLIHGTLEDRRCTTSTK